MVRYCLANVVGSAVVQEKRKGEKYSEGTTILRDV